MATMTGPQCAAPALTDGKLQDIGNLIDALDDGELKSELERCLTCVQVWWDLPTSKNKSIGKQAFGGGKSAECIPLDDSLIKSLDAVTPWMRELDSLSPTGTLPNGCPNPLCGTGLFDRIEDKELREAAFLLLWYCKEITQDREPMSQDTLK